jgi:hypothetical protein
MSYRQYQPGLMPTSLQDPYGQSFQRAQGIVKDYLLQLTRQATQLRFPDFASSDALGAIGDERLIDRGAGPQLVTQETDAAYAARLKAAWDIWYWAGTAFGMLTALAVQGYSPTIVQQNGRRFNLDMSGNLVITDGLPWTFPAPNLWNTFLVIFTTVPASWTNIQNPPTALSAPTIDEVERIVRIINLWRPAHMICAGLQAVISGAIWGIGTWGTPRKWGGSSVVFPVPVGQGV